MRKSGRGTVTRDRDVPYHGNTKKCLHIWVMRLWLERVPEKEQQIYLALGNFGAELQVSTERTAVEALDRKLELGFKFRSRRAAAMSS